MPRDARGSGSARRTLLLAAAVGAAAAGGAYLFAPTWPVAVAVATVYAPLAHLCLRDPAAVRERLLQNDAPRRVRLAQTCGVFGTGLGLGVFVARMRPDGFELAFALWLAGAALFFVLLPNYGARRTTPR